MEEGRSRSWGERLRKWKVRELKGVSKCMLKAPNLRVEDEEQRQIVSQALNSLRKEGKCPEGL